MSLDVLAPPTIHDVLADPILKRVLLKAPRLPGAHHTMPFRVWGVRHDGKWAGKTFLDYREAFELLKKMIKNRDTYEDAVITCRPVGFRAPAGLVLPSGTNWCGYCRRPTIFRRMSTHPAMKKWPVVGDEIHYRCHYCANKRQTVFHW